MLTMAMGQEESFDYPLCDDSSLSRLDMEEFQVIGDLDQEGQMLLNWLEEAESPVPSWIPRTSHSSDEGYSTTRSESALPPIHTVLPVHYPSVNYSSNSFDSIIRSSSTSLHIGTSGESQGGFGHLQCKDYLESSCGQSPHYVNNQVVVPQNETYLIADISEETEDTTSVDDEGSKIHIELLECRWEGCWSVFGSQSELVGHIERSHVEARRGDEFPCLWQNCPRRLRPFNARYKLLIHMRVHSGEKPNKCPFAGCRKSFSRLENLKIHQRSHTGERPYSCQFASCNKAFSNSSDRAKHQRTHFDTKPYACQVTGCNKRYTDPSSLRKHIKNHAGHHLAVKAKKLIASEPIISIADFQARCPILEKEILEVEDIEECSGDGDAMSGDNVGNFLNVPEPSFVDQIDSDLGNEYIEFSYFDSSSLLTFNDEDILKSFE